MAHSTSSVAPAATPAPTSTPTPARTTSPERVMIAYRGPSKRKGFAQIPNVVLLDKSLSFPAKVLYGLMVGYAMQHEAFETDQFAIAEDMGCTDRAIRKWMKELLDAGLLTITRRGLNQPNVYLIEDAYALVEDSEADELCGQDDTPCQEARGQGYVYLLESGGVYKIGKTNDLDRRISQIAPKLPYECRLVHAISSDNCLLLERWIHYRFGEWRLNGEWFQLTTDQVRWFLEQTELNQKDLA